MKKRILSCVLCMSLSMILTASPLYSLSAFAANVEQETVGTEATVTLPVSSGADITKAFNETIKTISSGTTIVIPAGSYTMDKMDIRNASNLSIVATGATIESSTNAALVYCPEGSNLSAFSLTGGTWKSNGRAIQLYGDSLTNISISDVTLSSNSESIRARNVNTLSIKNTTISSPKDHGIVLENSKNVTLENVSVNGGAAEGIRFIDCTGISGSNITSSGNSETGMRISGGSNIKLSNFIGKSNASYGVNIADSSDVSIAGGQVSNNKNTGIFVKGCSNLTLSGLTVSENAPSKQGNPGHGIHANDSTVKINDCTSYKNYWCGLSANGKNTKVTVNGGSFTNNGTRPDKKKNDDSVSAGIGVYAGATVSVSDATLSNNHGCGIAVSGDAKKKINCYANVYGCTINKNGDHGIGIRPRGIVTIDKSSSGNKNTIKKNKNHGILLNQNSTIKSMKNATVSSNGSSGISISVNSKANKISNCTFNGNKHHGIQVFDKASVSVSNSTFSKNKKPGIGIYGNGTGTLKKLTVNGGLSDGIRAGDRTAVVSITDSKITNNQLSGVNITDGATLKNMSKCTIKGNKKYGFELTNGAKAKSLKSNKISGNKKGQTLR